MEPELVDSILVLLGRCHLLVLHFPIALVVTAAALELFRARKPVVSGTSVTLVLFGALGAAATVGSGWLYAEEEGGGDPLFWHRWVGVASAVVILLAALVGLAARRKESGPASAYRGLLFLAAVLVSVPGHLGGSMVNGDGFFLEPFTGEGRARHDDHDDHDDHEEHDGDEPNEGGVPVTVGATGDTSSSGTKPVDFAAQIQPLFERSCYECHGPSGRAKGGLRLSDVPYLFDDDPDLAYVLPGDPEGSRLFEVITLPPGSEDAMPKKGDPLSDAEVALVARWIEEGAKY